MKVFFGFDDTDDLNSDYGTGKLVRWFQKELPDGCTCQGVVRQQLKVCDGIPYTSHNSSACLIVDFPDPALVNTAIDRAIRHIARFSAPGSDPGLCVMSEKDAALTKLIEFGYLCIGQIATQQQAIKAVGNGHLSGHGGTNDGIIGAAAAVGLTASGWAGRFIEFNGLRKYPDIVGVSELVKNGLHVISVDRDAVVPCLEDNVITNNWLRPRLIGGQPVVLVAAEGEGCWRHIHHKRNERHEGEENAA